MSLLETGLHATFWENVLAQVNKANIAIQNPMIDLHTPVTVLTTLKTFIEEKRDSFYMRRMELSGCSEYLAKTKRKRKINVRLAPLDTHQQLN